MTTTKTMTDNDVVVLTVSIEKLPQSLTPAQESELEESFVSAVMTAGVPKDDIKGIDFNKELTTSDDMDAAADDSTPLYRLSTVDIRIAGGSNTNLAATAEVLLLLSFQVFIEGTFTTALPKAIGICHAGQCTGPSVASDTDACPALDLMHFSAISYGRGRREEVFYETKTDTLAECAKLCLNYKGCGAIQYRSDRARCELSSVSPAQQQMNLIPSQYWEHHYREIFCTSKSQLQQAYADMNNNDDKAALTLSTTPSTVNNDANDDNGDTELTTTSTTTTTTAAATSSVAPTTTSIPAWTVDVSIIEREDPILDSISFVDSSGPKTALSKSSLIITVTAVLVILLILIGLACMSNSDKCCNNCKPRMPITLKKLSKSKVSTGSFKHWDITNSPDPEENYDLKQHSTEDLFWDGEGILALDEGDYNKFGIRSLSDGSSVQRSEGTEDEYIKLNGLRESDRLRIRTESDMNGHNLQFDDDKFAGSYRQSPMSSVGSFQYSAGSSHGTYVLASALGLGEFEIASDTDEDHGNDDAYTLANGGSPLSQRSYPGMLDSSVTIGTTYDNYRDLDVIANARIAKQLEDQIIQAAAAATRAVMQQKTIAETPCPKLDWQTSPNKVHLEGGRRGRRGGKRGDGSQTTGFIGV